MLYLLCNSCKNWIAILYILVIKITLLDIDLILHKLVFIIFVSIIWLNIYKIYYLNFKLFTVNYNQNVNFRANLVKEKVHII